MDDLLLYTHLAFLTLAVVGIVRADHEALGWLRGKHPTLAMHRLERSHWMVTIGLIGLVATGLYLFWPMREYLFGQPLFLLKLAFVMTLLLNSFFIESLMPLSSQYEFKNLPARKKTQLLFSGAVSSVSWAGAVLAAILLFGWPF